jgi:hypothetical protein
MQIKTCAKCGESRPLNDFAYLATYAQSKAWGRAGNVRMSLESKNCKACRPKRKPPTKLSAKEIHNKVQTGDMNVLVAKHLREKQAQDERNKQAMAARKRWLKTWRVELRTAIAPITREIASARKAWEYARDKGYVDKAEFYFRYHAILKHEKAHIELSHATDPRRPHSARWADYLSDNVFTIVREMWAGLPPIYKQSRTPMLIKHRDEFTQVNKDSKFVPPRSLAFLKGERR